MKNKNVSFEWFIYLDLLIEPAQSLPQALVNPTVAWWKNIRITIIIASLSFLLFFLFLFAQSQVTNFYAFQNSPDEIILARTFYHVPNIEAKFPNMAISKYHFSQYQLYPLYLRLFLEFCLFDSWFSIPLAVFPQNLILFSSFYFMLSTCSIVHRPFVTISFLIVFPFTFINQRNSALPSSLSLSFVFLAFAFLEKKRILYLSIFACLAILVEFQGIIASLAIFIYFIITKQFKNCFYLFIFTCIAFGVISIESSIMYHDKFAFLKQYETFFSFTPFVSFIQLHKLKPIRFYFQTLVTFLIPSIAGLFDIYFISIPLFIYCLISLIFIIFFNQTDVEYFFAGFSIFSILIGFDKMFNWLVNHVSLFVLLLFGSLILWLSAYSMRFNSVSQDYLDYSMNLIYPFI